MNPFKGAVVVTTEDAVKLLTEKLDRSTSIDGTEYFHRRWKGNGGPYVQLVDIVAGHSVYGFMPLMENELSGVRWSTGNGYELFDSPEELIEAVDRYKAEFSIPEKITTPSFNVDVNKLDIDGSRILINDSSGWFIGGYAHARVIDKLIADLEKIKNDLGV